MRRTLLYLQVCVGFVLSAPTETSAADPSLVNRYERLQVSDLQLNEDAIDKVLQKLIEVMRKDQRGTSISAVLVTPSAQLLSKRVTQRLQNNTLRQILDELCVTFDLQYTLDHHTVIVGAKGVDLSKRGLRMESPRDDERLETGMRIVIPDLESTGTDFTAAANTIKEQSDRYNATGKPFVLESKADVTKQRPKVYAWFPLVVSAEAIEYICMSAGLRFSSPGQGVYILLGK